MGFNEVRKEKTEKIDGVLSFYPFENNKEDFVASSHWGDVGKKASKIFAKKSKSRWVDDALLLNGKVFYYRGFYDSALIQFQYITTYYPKDYHNDHIRGGYPKKYEKALKQAKKAKKPISNSSLPHKYARNEAIIWLAKSLIKLEKYSDAQSVILNAEADWSFPIEYRTELNKVKATLHIAKKEYNPALELMKNILEKTKDKKELARNQFITAQIYELVNDKSKALGLYHKVLLGKAHEDLKFESIMKISELSSKGAMNATISDLRKLLNKGSNINRLDRIYYAIGNCYAQINDKDQAIENYLKSIAVSKNNDQKFLSYEKIGTFFLNKKNYITAGKYYDSANLFIPSDYKFKEEFKNKTKALLELSNNNSIYEKNDSIIQLVQMGKSKAKALISKKLNKEKREEENRQIIESTKLEAQNSAPSSTNNSNWYFGNASTVARGKDIFQKKWGKIKLKDNWKLAPPELLGSSSTTETLEDKFKDVDKTSLASDDIADIELSRLPFEGPAKEKIIVETQEALLKMARIYHYDIKDIDKAIETYNMAWKRYTPFSKDEEEILYALYLQYNESSDFAKANEVKNKLFETYPKSKYIDFIKNPNRKDQESKEELAASAGYKKIFASYEAKNYSKTINLCKEFIENNRENKLVSKYMLLKAMAHSKYYQFDEYVSTLDTIVNFYPSAKEYNTAKEWLEYAKKVNKDSFQNPLLQANNANTSSSTQKTESLFSAKASDSAEVVTSIAKEAPTVNFYFNPNGPHLSVIAVSDVANIYTVKNDLEKVVYKTFPNSKILVELIYIQKNPYISIGRFDKVAKALGMNEFLKSESTLSKYAENFDYTVISTSNFDLLQITGAWSRYKEFYELNY
jgi:tetratricopeptide (TPR) repeat protein